jgi:hypothetical protein
MKFWIVQYMHVSGPVRQQTAYFLLPRNNMSEIRQRDNEEISPLMQWQDYRLALTGCSRFRWQAVNRRTKDRVQFKGLADNRYHKRINPPLSDAGPGSGLVEPAAGGS